MAVIACMGEVWPISMDTASEGDFHSIASEVNHLDDENPSLSAITLVI